MPAGVKEWTGGALALVLLLLGSAVTLVLAQRARLALLRAVGRSFRITFRRNIGDLLESLNSELSKAVILLRRRPSAVVYPVALAAADWGASVMALGLCFYAFGYHIQAGVLLTGFMAGVVAGSLSMIPGGLGVQEGSMAAVYSLLGVPFGRAVLTTILFRLVYYLLPFAVSLPFYHRLLRREG